MSKVMSRRSARLVSGGYYQSDEDSDSSSVTNISYRESPVRVFKKKAGNRKAASRTSSRANSNASSVSTELPVTADQYKGLTPDLQTSQTQQTTKTVPYTTTMATPRPALTPVRGRSTPTDFPTIPPESGPSAGLYRPHHPELNQSNIDSSGYSSAEGPYKRATATSSTSSPSSTSGALISGHSSSSRSSDPSSLMSSISVALAAVQSRITLLTAPGNASFSTGMKKAFGLLLFLIFVILCVWFLLPLLASLISRMTAAKTPTPTAPKSQPVPPVVPRPAPSQPAAASPPAPAVDPAIVSATVQKEMQSILGKLMLKQESLYAQMEERIQLDMQGVRAEIEAADSDGRLRLEREVAGLSRQVADYRTDGLTAAAGLEHKIQAVEAENAKLSQELSSIQMRPPPAPCPDPAAAPLQNQLTPELQQAMEKWLSDRIKARH
ncbi:uncharacterized protein ACJ7VT_012971 [Polymixia lowei]